MIDFSRYRVAGVQRWFVLGLLLAAFGCNGDETEELTPVDHPPLPCASGEWQREDGACIPAGLPPDMPCPPGEWQREDGACIPPGVPVDGCGEGFVHDGDGGCEPILPDAPCGPGLMAVPGDTACHAIAPCGQGTWGDIPVEPDTEYVDMSYAGMDGDGSALKPWTSIQAAVDVAAPGAIVAIAAGSYVEDIDVSFKPVRLWGVCPSLVDIMGTSAVVYVIQVRQASGTEVHNLAMHGAVIGFVTTGSRDVLLEGVHVYGISRRGINLQNDLGPTHMTLRGSLVAQNQEVGVFVAGSGATIEGSVMRDTAPTLTGSMGWGLSVQSHPTNGTPATLELRKSLVEHNHEIGIFMEGTDATIETSVIRDTQPNGQDATGHGVVVQSHPTTGAPSTLALYTSLLADNQQMGLVVVASNATVENSVIRGTKFIDQGITGAGVTVEAHPTTGAASMFAMRTSLVEDNQANGFFVTGSQATLDAIIVRQSTLRGVEIASDATTGAASKVELRTSVIEHSHEIGMYVGGSDATVEASVIRDTEVNASGALGRGIGVEPYEFTGAPSTFLLRSSLVERNHEVGMYVSGSQATVETSVIRETALESLGFYGRGLNAQASTTWGTASTLTVSRALIEQSQEAGLVIVGATATIDASVIRETSPASDGQFGHGVMVVFEGMPTSATITRTRIEGSALAALAVWGAHAAVGDSRLICQSFDLDSETYQGQSASLENLGGNACGCPEPTEPCKAVSAGLEPPKPIQ